MQPSSEELHAGEGDPVQDWVQGGVWQEIQKGASTSTSTSTCTSMSTSTRTWRSTRFHQCRFSPLFSQTEYQPARSKILFLCWDRMPRLINTSACSKPKCLITTQVKSSLSFITSGVSRWTLPSQNWPRVLSGTWDSFDNQYKSTWGVVMKKTSIWF